jgi:uncharacterized surface protein with fasciclin (FAS1) repeats
VQGSIRSHKSIRSQLFEQQQQQQQQASMMMMQAFTLLFTLVVVTVGSASGFAPLPSSRRALVRTTTATHAVAKAKVAGAGSTKDKKKDTPKKDIPTPATTTKKDIVETALAAGSFSTLAAALGAADLIDTLKGEGPFTVFAPTDEAFAKLPEGTVDDLLKPENKEKLAGILTYHVLSGQKVMASSVLTMDGKKVATVNGASVVISVDGATVKVDDATVVTTDVDASNGVIHIIDSVMMPKA